MNYQETGNKIPVTEEELLKVMNQKYTDYYNNKTLPNPDTEDVIYTTQNGKTIKIPDEIKIKAKTIWLKSLMRSEPSKKIIKTNKKSTNFINMIILFIAALIALYVLYILTANFRKSYNTGIDILKK